MRNHPPKPLPSHPNKTESGHEDADCHRCFGSLFCVCCRCVCNGHPRHWWVGLVPLRRPLVRAIMEQQMTHPDQSSPQAVWFTFASSGADNRTSTNSPQHDAFKGSAILPHRSENVRMKLPRHPEPKPNKLENASRGSKPILIAHHVPSLRSLPSQLWFEHVGPGGVLPRCFPGLFPQSFQDSHAEVSQRFPSIACQGVSLFNLLCSLVLHVLNNGMEKIRYVRNSIGKFQHEYQYRSPNSEEQDSACGSLPISGGTYSPRIPEARVVVQQNA